MAPPPAPLLASPLAPPPASSSTSSSASSSSSKPPDPCADPPAFFGEAGNSNNEGFESQGCFRYNPQNPLLPYFERIGSDNTPEVCRYYCSTIQGGKYHFPYFGSARGQECYYGQVLLAGAERLPDSACNKLCRGNSEEEKCQPCGGDLAVNVYFNPKMRRLFIRTR